MKIIAGCLFLSLIVGCTEGSVGEIVCFSGGKEIYRGKSTGKISTESHGDGWYFVEEGTKDLIRVSGDCLIRN